MQAIVLAAFLGLPQAQAGEDAVVLRNREEMRGTIEGMDPAGTVRFRERSSSRVIEIPVEENLRWRLEGTAAAAPTGTEQLRLHAGGTLTGRLRAYRDGIATIETDAGTFSVPRSGIDAIVLRPGSKAVPGAGKKGAPDFLVRSDPALAGPAGEAGVLREIDTDAVFDQARVPREEVLEVRFFHDGPVRESPPGWFVKITLSNGDTFAAAPRSLDGDRLCAFSPVLGRLEIPRNRVREVAFVATARTLTGRVLVSEGLRVREIEIETRRSVWSYASANTVVSVRRMENGNVLVGMQGRILEVCPVLPEGGTVLSELDCAGMPYDAMRLENGNTLCAEYDRDRVVEYDREGRIAWKRDIRSPLSAQRLDGVRTLICTDQNQHVIEVDAAGKVAWRLPVPVARPARAVRLDNGNTLVTSTDGFVVEVDPQGRQVWRMDGLQRPVAALRSDDGHTLILEQGKGRIIRVDSAGKVVGEIPGLENPVSFFAY